ncbi:transposase [Streptomyces sp. NPDC097704]|uniref:transposase n=1 Tax=Streptomyces sp. NPDC097704 TaxID=3157101 RepID=UPI003316FA5E
MPLTDAQWARVEPLLPDRTPKRGGRSRDHRQVINAIAYEFQTGVQWSGLRLASSALAEAREAEHQRAHCRTGSCYWAVPS